MALNQSLGAVWAKNNAARQQCSVKDLNHDRLQPDECITPSQNTVQFWLISEVHTRTRHAMRTNAQW